MGRGNISLGKKFNIFSWFLTFSPSVPGSPCNHSSLDSLLSVAESLVSGTTHTHTHTADWENFRLGTPCDEQQQIKTKFHDTVSKWFPRINWYPRIIVTVCGGRIRASGCIERVGYLVVA